MARESLGVGFCCGASRDRSREESWGERCKQRRSSLSRKKRFDVKVLNAVTICFDNMVVFTPWIFLKISGPSTGSDSLHLIPSFPNLAT
jgi:hypothetical protein